MAPIVFHKEIFKIDETVFKLSGKPVKDGICNCKIIEEGGRFSILIKYLGESKKEE